MAHNAAEAVVKLNSNDVKHIETYKKIMARKSNGEEQFANVEDDNDEQDDGGNAGAGVQPVAGYGLDLDPYINEQLLWHGAAPSKVKSIVEEGFDVRLAKRSGLYGEGVYFAEQSCKSFQYCDQDAGIHSIILARVAIGDPFYTQAPQKSLLRPPERTNGSGRYDSVVANVGIANAVSAAGQQHREVVVFDGSQTYPELVIHFTI